MLVARDHRLGLTDSLTPYFKAASLLDFDYYARQVLYPYARADRARRSASRSWPERNSLCAIADYLRQTGKIGLMHNEDDILLSADELDFLRDVFGARAQIYPKGGHVGNLLYRDNVAYVIDFFRTAGLLDRDGETSDRAAPAAARRRCSARAPARPPLPPEIAARPELADVAEQPSVLDVFDPLERFNRAMYNFNAGFDRYIFLPIVQAYEFVTPDFVADRISDFFNNFRELPTFANALLQLKGEIAGRAAVRFVVNTMFTGGLYDLAGAQGISQISEDFGQTLGHWGAGPGTLSGAAGARAVQSARRDRPRRRRGAVLAADAETRCSSRSPTTRSASACSRSIRGVRSPSATTRPARRSSTSWSGCSTARSASSTSRTELAHPARPTATNA